MSKAWNYDVKHSTIRNSFAKAEFIVSNKNSTNMDDKKDDPLDEIRKYEYSRRECPEKYEDANNQNSEINNNSLNSEMLKSFETIHRRLQFQENTPEEICNTFQRSFKVFFYFGLSSCLLSVYLSISLSA